MKSKKTLLVLIVVFALVIVGASVLYEKLGAQVQSSQLAVQSTQAPTKEPQENDEAPQENDEAPQEGGEAAQEQKEYVPAPDFTVYDGEGNEVHLSSYIGKPIVLNFWASWCGPCQMEMPDFQEKYLEIGNEVQFLMINMTTGRETVQSADRFISSNGYTFPVFYDTQSDAAITYGAYSLPTTYFIDADGYVIAYASGAIDAQLLQVGLDMIYSPAE